MKAVFATLAMCAAYAAAQSLPTLPGDWSGIVIQRIAINQGGISEANGDQCCPATSPECKIQTAYGAFKQYFSVKHQAIANRNPDGSGVVTNFTAGKEFEVDAKGNCQAYCPLPREEQGPLTPIGYGENATNLGPTIYNGRKVDKIEWRVVIPILNITMQVSDFYVDVSTTPPTPVAEIDDIEPAGEQMGLQNTTYASFQAGEQPASAFLVKDPASCPMSKQCQGDDDGGQGGDDMPMTTEAATALLGAIVEDVRLAGTHYRSRMLADSLPLYESESAAAGAFGLAVPSKARALEAPSASVDEVYAMLGTSARVDRATLARVLASLE